MNKLSSRASIEFLFIELQTGITFANLALSAKPYETDKIESDRANARKAYDSFLKFKERVELSEEQGQKLDAGSAKLKSALRALGESV